VNNSILKSSILSPLRLKFEGDGFLSGLHSAKPDGLDVSIRGTKRWYLNDRLHRSDGPAVEKLDGSKSWWRAGRLHREDGPAVENSDGSTEWWLNGTKVTWRDVWENFESAYSPDP